MKLPQKLDKLLFEKLGATHCPDFHQAYRNLRADEVIVRRYLGTYFPRSYVESREIFSHLLPLLSVQQVLVNRPEIFVLDIGSGTGGNLAGLIDALTECFPRQRPPIRVVSIDGNQIALDYQQRVVEAYFRDRAVVLDRQCVTVLPSPVPLSAIQACLERYKQRFDLVTSSKFLSELYLNPDISRPGFCQSLLRICEDHLADRGLAAILDVTLKMEADDVWTPDPQLINRFIPSIFNEETLYHIRSNKSLERGLRQIIPLSCAVNADKCGSPRDCFHRRFFTVEHSHICEPETFGMTYKIMAKSRFARNVLSEISGPADAWYRVAESLDGHEADYCQNGKRLGRSLALPTGAKWVDAFPARNEATMAVCLQDHKAVVGTVSHSVPIDSHVNPVAVAPPTICTRDHWRSANQKWDRVQVITDHGPVLAVEPVIISASRSTDIPAFYADWFIEQMKRGYVKRINPFDRQSQYVSFQKARVIVFASKNPKPMIPHLEFLDQRGLGYYFTFTLNDYEREGMEPGLPPLADRITTFKELSRCIGKEKVIWKFDPLILMEGLDTTGLLEKIQRVGDQIHEFTEKLVISFVDISVYKKVQRKLRQAEVKYTEFDREAMERIAAGLQVLNQRWGLEIATCAELIDLSRYGIVKNSCIDGDLMARLFDNDELLKEFLAPRGRRRKLRLPSLEDFEVQGNRQVAESVNSGLKDPGQRLACGCIVSKDIGQYNTCMHLCRYCCVSASESEVRANYERYKRTTSESILPD